MIWGILLPGLFGVLSKGANVEGPSEFYMVTFVDHDVVSAWEYRILDVKQNGRDSLICSIMIGPIRHECPRRLTVRAAEARLPNISPAQLTTGQNPCNGNPRSEDKTARSVFRFGTISRAGVVTKCGLEDRQPWCDYIADNHKCIWWPRCFLGHFPRGRLDTPAPR